MLVNRDIIINYELIKIADRKVCFDLLLLFTTKLHLNLIDMLNIMSMIVKMHYKMARTFSLQSYICFIGLLLSFSTFFYPTEQHNITLAAKESLNRIVLMLNLMILMDGRVGCY